MLGLVVFPFALREKAEEPNPCNIRLAEAVKRIVEDEPEEIIIVAQWEVARALESMNVAVEHIVELREDGSYLDSEAVWREAIDDFGSRHADDGWIHGVIPVAQPFLQLMKVKQMIKDDEYSEYIVIDRPVGWIGFDRESTQ